MTGLWFEGKFAPEIAEKDGQWYVAGYSRGLYVAKFKWERKTPAEIAAWREKWQAYLREELRKMRQREAARKKAADAGK